ncbi:uncharacterized protein DS421_19g635830 [Arachis hypogaea]|uniref:Uncharacterized protein n=1 Tax=Arachis hypogaea TaxID=3818 RepID=A0A6B9V505_ARAHY|nr:uncharacterized protein DS421_19g635830 [Arachis hypogaea]
MRKMRVIYILFQRKEGEEEGAAEDEQEEVGAAEDEQEEVGAAEDGHGYSQIPVEEIVEIQLLDFGSYY